MSRIGTTSDATTKDTFGTKFYKNILRHIFSKVKKYIVEKPDAGAT